MYVYRSGRGSSSRCVSIVHVVARGSSAAATLGNSSGSSGSSSCSCGLNSGNQVDIFRAVVAIVAMEASIAAAVSRGLVYGLTRSWAGGRTLNRARLTYCWILKQPRMAYDSEAGAH